MTATAHALVGGAIAASIPNPAIGIPLAAATHPFIDMIPHWDFGWGWKKKTRIRLFTEASLDLILGLCLAYFIFGRNVNPIYFLLAVLFSEIWDMLEAPYWFLGWKFPPFSYVYKVQSSMQGKTKTVFNGILTQVATVAGFVLVLRVFH